MNDVDVLNAENDIAVPEFLSGGGEMGQRIREYDWASTSLGAVNSWPQSLRSAISICLNSNFPIAIYWGKDLTLLYNDAWSPIPGDKHPWALGKPAKEVWPEIWKDIEPQFQKAFNGKPGGSKDALLPMHRHGYTEECYFDFTFTPVYGEGGKVEGIFNAVIETTKTILNERQLQTLRGLGKVDRTSKKVDELLIAAAQVLEGNNKDFPFAIIYKINEDINKAVPTGYIGLNADQHVFPTEIDLTKPTEQTANFYQAYISNQMVVSENNGRRINLPKGGWDKEATHFVHLPIATQPDKVPVAILSAALNPYRQFDESYRQFAQLIADQISTEVNNVLAFEKEKKRAEALAEIDQAKTAFFTNISHEFRTPLTLMLGSLEELINNHSNEIENENRQTAETAHRNAVRLLRLVNNLLDFSKLEAGRIKATYQLTDIAKYTAHIASSFRSVIENAGLQFHVSCDSIAEPVYIDQDMWEKIVLNLLSNAFKYTLEGSITVSITAENSKVLLKVRDTGIGIPESELPKMFQRFHRVQNVTGRTYEGTGIGLSFVKELVQLHEGEISVNSKVGEGSEFIITIPTGKHHLQTALIIENEAGFTTTLADAFIEEADSLIEQPASSSYSLQGEEKPDTVLVVDDNADMRNYVQGLLRKQYNVFTAANGLDALNKMKEHKIDLVVSDIMMPVMDGIQLLKTIKETPQTATLPVILVSARAGEEAKVEGFEIGADDYLVKPFSAKELIARVSAQIRLARKRNNTLQEVYNLFDEVPFSVAVLKGESLIIEYINQCNLDIWQKSKEMVLGKPLYEANPAIRKGAEAIHDEVYRTGKRFVSGEVLFELVIDGKPELRYFSAVVDPVRDEEGKLIGQLATSIDVTAQVLARKKIEESEERLAIAIEGGELGTFDFYLQTGKLYWSAKNKALFGLPPDVEVDNSMYFKGLHPDDKERAIATANKAMRPENGGLYENEYRTIGITDGKLRWVHSKGKVTFDEEGNPLRFTGITQDITLQKQADEKIRESESRFRSLAETLPQMIWVSDANGVKEYYSNKWKEYSGIDDLYKAWEYMIHPEDEHISTTAFEQAFASGTPFHYEVRLKNAAGEYRWHSSIAEPIKDASGNVIKWVGALSDIQEHKTAQQAIQSLMEKKDEFISIASHELKTPVTSMKASLQLAERLLKQNAEPATLRTFIEKANLQVNKITGLIDELLDVTKIQAGKIALNKSLFPVEDFVKDAVEHLTAVDTSHKIIIQACAPIQVYADRHRLEQVLTNLIANGIKYSPGADTIDILVERVDHSLKFSVTDYGIGIAPDKVPYVFERFYRVQEAATMFSGLGLGLYISAEIVKRHGGEIGVNSKPGKGSTFWFTIPIE